MNKNKIGLTLGCFVAAIHLIWVLLIWIIPRTNLQTAINWIFSIHGLVPYLALTGLTFLNAVILIVLTFIIGYVTGWLFAGLSNLVDKK